jgi:hypothetical protein
MPVPHNPVHANEAKFGAFDVKHPCSPRRLDHTPNREDSMPDVVIFPGVEHGETAAGRRFRRIAVFGLSAHSSPVQNLRRMIA